MVQDRTHDIGNILEAIRDAKEQAEKHCPGDRDETSFRATIRRVLAEAQTLVDRCHRAESNSHSRELEAAQAERKKHYPAVPKSFDPPGEA